VVEGIFHLSQSHCVTRKIKWHAILNCQLISHVTVAS
jgi:hypothetical protein